MKKKQLEKPKHTNNQDENIEKAYAPELYENFFDQSEQEVEEFWTEEWYDNDDDGVDEEENEENVWRED